MAEGQNKDFLTTNGHPLTRMGREFNAEARRGRRIAKEDRKTGRGWRVDDDKRVVMGGRGATTD